MDNPKYDPATWAAAAARAQAKPERIAAYFVKARLPAGKADPARPIDDDDGGIDFDVSVEYGGEA